MRTVWKERAAGSVRLVQALVAAAEVDGVDRDVLLDRAGIPRDVMQSSKGWVDYEQVLALFAAAVEETGNQDWGLLAPAKIDPRAFGVIGYVVQHSENVLAALKQVTSVGRVLVVEGGDVFFRDDPEALVVGYVYPPYMREFKQSQEFAVSLIVLLARVMTATDVVPLSVHFPHSEPPDLRAHRAMFRCPLHFNAPVAEVWLPRSAGELPFPDADPNLVEILRTHSNRMLEELTTRDVPFSDRVRRAVAAGIREGTIPGIDDVATTLGVSRRTLQRRLGTQKLTFAEVIDQTRREKAVAELANPKLTLIEVALRAGYSDASTFHRAFKRWTGQTPAEYRAAVAPAPSAEAEPDDG